jgi:hypothetical protein
MVHLAIYYTLVYHIEVCMKAHHCHSRNIYAAHRENRDIYMLRSDRYKYSKELYNLLNCFKMHGLTPTGDLHTHSTPNICHIHIS